MPNGKTHKDYSLISFLPSYKLLIEDKTGFNKQHTLLEVLTTGVGMISSSKLTDILEPAISPIHRKFFHSIAFSSMVCSVGYYSLRELQLLRRARAASGIKEITFTEVVNIFITSVSLSYLLHLIADGFTPKGLPFWF